jgi:hypothetical protein
VFDCETTPIRRFAAAGCARTSMPATKARSPVGITVVVSIPIVVDLPAPFGPSRPKNSPASIARSTPSTAVTEPPWLA